MWRPKGWKVLKLKYLNLLGWSSHIQGELSLHWYREALISLWEEFTSKG